MNKIFAAFVCPLLLALCLLTGSADAAETKLPLSDSLTLDEFVTGYNAVCRHPIADYSRHKPSGNNESHLGIIDDKNIMMLETDQAGILQKIIIMHHGEIDDQSRAMLGEIFSCANVALGYKITDDESMIVLTAAFNLLEITDKTIGSSSLSRHDIGREYVFVKAYAEQSQVYSILFEALAE